MPIRILALPAKDLQHTLKCMDIGDLIAFSLCSIRTKNLAKSSNRKIEPIFVEVCFHLTSKEYEEIGEEVDLFARDHDYIFLIVFDYVTVFDNRSGWQKWEFTRSDWIAHFMSIFNESIVHKLEVSDYCPQSHLDDIKHLIPKLRKLRISHLQGTEFAKKAFLKLSPLAIEQVEIHTNVFSNKYKTSDVLTSNLNSVSFNDWKKPLKLEIDELLVVNIINLTIKNANITDNELN
ncbi:hypothetical protein B9Z55_021594 [Caenorhabditis nigoni]|uniref:F-box domain-containing protein n=1 Tax=Caenorhabditis nigoni TaxID=1611254 RepID=A0A2G5TSR0_9PELO|nr:hypothetical protein B9Z55_021594 [Caenorhabditis nigoni]